MTDSNSVFKSSRLKEKVDLTNTARLSKRPDLPRERYQNLTKIGTKHHSLMLAKGHSCFEDFLSWFT